MGFRKYLELLGTLSESSINDDMNRINSMLKRGIDYTKGEDFARKELDKSDLSDSTIKRL